HEVAKDGAATLALEVQRESAFACVVVPVKEDAFESGFVFEERFVGSHTVAAGWLDDPHFHAQTCQQAAGERTPLARQLEPAQAGERSAHITPACRSAARSSAGMPSNSPRT